MDSWKKFYLIFTGCLFASAVIFGIYISDHADAPTWIAHILQWGPILLAAISFYMLGIIYVKIQEDNSIGMFGIIGLIAMPFLVCPVGYILGYHLI